MGTKLEGPFTDETLLALQAECQSSLNKYGPYPFWEHGVKALNSEFNELIEEIKVPAEDINLENVKGEALQVANTALMLYEIVDKTLSHVTLTSTISCIKHSFVGTDDETICRYCSHIRSEDCHA